ncbi:MAG TPA: DUF3667 domain-containing protein [Chitinophagaceae bacterium]|nr:DUF3667 domain-containing protein [Chitinophagaceae bacterium]
MSHFKERSEKVCLNCKAELHGRYCHQCGQENIEPRESFLHLLKHFFYDITHFDSKFFGTIKILLLKPGFLSKEYIAGKRASHLNPVRMYVFTSAFFFLIFFSIINPEKSFKTSPSVKYQVTGSAKEMTDFLTDLKEEVTEEMSVGKDTAARNKSSKILAGIERDLVRIKKDSTIKRDSLESAEFYVKKYWNKSYNYNLKYKTLSEYDSAMNTLPKAERDSRIRQYFARKEFAWKEKYGNDGNKVAKVVIEKFIHSIPQMLFVSLPFLALFLKLLYIRRRKQFYYADHGIFSIHLYCAIFISLLVIFGINKMEAVLHWDWLSWVSGVAIFLIFVYPFLAMKRFYSQGFFKTFLKYGILLFLVVLLTSILMLLFLLLSIIKI